MRVKMHRSLALVLLVVGVACGDPDDGDEEQSGSPIQTGGLPDAGGVASPLPDAGGALGGSTVDASGPVGLEAGTPALDAGLGPVGLDSGSSVPGSDAGAAGSDAGQPDAAQQGAGEQDAAAAADAGGDGSASGCELTYENFGKQFMTKYCTNCHTGLFASHFVQLDTLANVQANKAAVKQQAVTGTTMPQADPKPTAAERQQLGQWLDCGPN